MPGTRVEGGKATLCMFRCGRESFSIESAEIREVIGAVRVLHVPRAPSPIAGIVPYRGEVLLAVSLVAVLEGGRSGSEGCALVLRDGETLEEFALLVDSVADVVEVERADWEPNPATLSPRRQSLYSGIFRRPEGSIVRLETARVQPSRLVGTFEALEESL